MIAYQAGIEEHEEDEFIGRRRTRQRLKRKYLVRPRRPIMPRRIRTIKRRPIKKWMKPHFSGPLIPLDKDIKTLSNAIKKPRRYPPIITPRRKKKPIRIRYVKGGPRMIKHPFMIKRPKVSMVSKALQDKVKREQAKMFIPTATLMEARDKHQQQNKKELKEKMPKQEENASSKYLTIGLLALGGISLTVLIGYSLRKKLLQNGRTS